ncbi:MAG: hypothetical protein JSV25_04010 [Spirochaetota bacterium]|nr:MAG: hypothetical protein JSV25_04010 [Spirochaetota bacterium]
MGTRISQIFTLLGLVILAFIIAGVIWFMMISPLRIMKPLEFIPLEITEEHYESVNSKLNSFIASERHIKFNKYEVGALLIESIRGELMLDITEIYIDFQNHEIMVILKTRIDDIPSLGYWQRIFKRRKIDYTTTMIHAAIGVSDGAIIYDIKDFRFGGFKIPEFIIRRIVREGRREFQDIYLEDISFTDETMGVTRR